MSGVATIPLLASSSRLIWLRTKAETAHQAVLLLVVAFELCLNGLLDWVCVYCCIGGELTLHFLFLSLVIVRR